MPPRARHIGFTQVLERKTMKPAAILHPWIAMHRIGGASARRVQGAPCPAAVTEPTAALIRSVVAAARRSSLRVPNAFDRTPAHDRFPAATSAASAAKAATAHWRGPRAPIASWVEGLVLVLLVAFFVGGQIAILGGS
jgi:hypothetical protein